MLCDGRTQVVLLRISYSLGPDSDTAVKNKVLTRQEGMSHVATCSLCYSETCVQNNSQKTQRRHSGKQIRKRHDSRDDRLPFSLKMPNKKSVKQPPRLDVLTQGDATWAGAASDVHLPALTALSSHILCLVDMWHLKMSVWMTAQVTMGPWREEQRPQSPAILR